MRRAMLVSAVALLLVAPAVVADLAPRPRPGNRPPIAQPPQSPRVKVSIEVDEKAAEPRLIIPMQVLMGGGFGGGAGFGGGLGAIGVPPGGQIGAPPGGAGILGNPPPGAALGGGGGAPPGGINPPGGGQPPSPDEDAAPPASQTSLPFSTLVVGLALTLSLSTGGLWAVRRKTSKPGGGLTLLVLVAVTAIAVVGTTVWANRAPPPRPVQPGQPLRPQASIPGPLPALMRMDGVKVDVVQQGDTVRLILTKKQKATLQPKGE